LKQATQFLRNATTLFVVALLCTGCATGSKSAGPNYYPGWAYSPDELIVHQLSRVANSTNPEKPSKVVVHIKFYDSDGFACRSMGLLKIMVNNNNSVVMPVDLNDKDKNRKCFDPVTRTYVVDFDMNIPDSMDVLDIKVTLIDKSINTIVGEGEIVVRKNI
jgi:hypothetical protein